MNQYIDIVKRVLMTGKEKFPVRKDVNGKFIPVDGGVKTIACPNVLFSHDMSDGFPLLTTKKMAWKAIRVELEGFINGITDKKWYQDRGCKIWNSWANPEAVEKCKEDSHSIDNLVGWGVQDVKKIQKAENDLGRIYGFVWRSFGSDDEIVRIQPKKTSHELINEEDIDLKELCKQVDKKGLSELDSILYKNWYDMLNRCYNSNCTQYEWYGAKGKKVCRLWLSFYSYKHSLKTINNWASKQRWPKDYSLDKDYYCSDHYAPDVCVFLSNKDNKLYNSSICLKISNSKESYKVLNFTQAANIIGVTGRAVSMALEDKRMCKDWNIEKIEGVWRKRLPTDQLYTIVDTLRNNPMDRRMVCSAWNPTILGQAALPSCHYVWNVTVIGDELHLFWAQRSCDLMLGVPFNIASYGLLLSLLAKEAGLRPGNLSGMLVDCHIYENQVEAAKQQALREPSTLPLICIPEPRFNIFDWKHTDVELINYHPDKKINFGEVTV